MNRADAIRLKLKTFGLEHYTQSGMPGLRWTIWGHGWTRTLTTAEAVIFLDGYGFALADRDVC